MASYNPLDHARRVGLYRDHSVFIHPVPHLRNRLFGGEPEKDRIMSLPQVSMRQLLEAGVHFGHQKHRWNPKMEPYIFGVRSNIHIIDLSQTLPLFHQVLVKVREVAARGGRILFVGTKRQASEPVKVAAKRCAQYYVNHRWLGGTMTNWATITNSINRLRKLEEMLSENSDTGLTKKELIRLTREQSKLERSLGGIKDMGGLPDMLFIIDTNKEVIALKEARKLKIPVAAVIDTNSAPEDADFPIPGNDDAARAISLYCELVADAILDGMADEQADMGVDPGAAVNPVEPALAEVVEKTAKADTKPEASAKKETVEPVKTVKESSDTAATEEPAKKVDTKKEVPAVEKKEPAKETAPANKTTDKSAPVEKETKE